MLNAKFHTNIINDTRAEFTIEPLDPGFGYSIGSALRRVLLSSIEGPAITAVKIEGVQHEFAVYEGLREDITEFLLRIRETRFNVAEGSTNDRWEISMKKSKEGEILASDLKVPSDLTIVNPEHILGHLNTKTTLEFVAVVELGRGFIVSENSEDDPVGTIHLDATFSPIEKVAYQVTPARVGQRTDYDKLTLSIDTDGSRSPEPVLQEAVQILRDTLNVFYPEPDYPANIDDTVETGDEAEMVSHGGLEDLPVEELELGVRAFNCLVAANIKRIGELLKYSKNDLSTIPNFGKKSQQEVIEALESRGLSLTEDDSV